MTQFNAPMRRTGGDLDVYAGLLAAACLALLVGVIILAMRNTEHSKLGNSPGGMFHLVDKPRR
jgi:hypothetical protein